MIELNRQENWGAPPPRKGASLHTLGPPQFQRLSLLFLHFRSFFLFLFLIKLFLTFPIFLLLFLDFNFIFFPLFPRSRNIPRSLPTCVSSGPVPRLFEFPPHSANSVILLPWLFPSFVFFTFFSFLSLSPRLGCLVSSQHYLVPKISNVDRSETEPPLA